MTTEAAPPLAEGRYRLLEPLGMGGMAAVYRAFDTRLQVPRAIKLLLPALANRPKLRARFEAEARTMALLEHRNIVRVYDVGVEGNRVYIVMELVEGGSLVDRLERLGPLHPQQALKVGIDILTALSVAHAHGVIHRDIKPHNVLITSENEIRVTDFGIARLTQTNDSLTKTGAVMGTWAFMAPEQRADAKNVDERADLYAVAATIFTTVTRETPMDLFAAELDASMLAKLPAPVARVVRKATQYSRDDRYASAAEMAQALRDLEHELPELPTDALPLAVPRPRSRVGPPAGSSIISDHETRTPVGGPQPTMVPNSPPPDSGQTFSEFSLSDATSEPPGVVPERGADNAWAPANTRLPMETVAADPAQITRPRTALWVVLGLLVMTTGALWWSWGQPGPTPEPAAAPTTALPPVPAEPPVPADGAAATQPPVAGADLVSPAAADVAGATSTPTDDVTSPKEPAPKEPTPKVPSSGARTGNPDKAPAPVGAVPAPTAEQGTGSAGAGAPSTGGGTPVATEAAPDTAPSMSHSPLTQATLGQTITFTAAISGGQYKVTLYYRPDVSGMPYQRKLMANHGGTYSVSVPLTEEFAPGVRYHIKATPEETGLPALNQGDGFSPFRIAVSP